MDRVSPDFAFDLGVDGDDLSDRTAKSKNVAFEGGPLLFYVTLSHRGDARAPWSKLLCRRTVADLWELGA